MTVRRLPFPFYKNELELEYGIVVIKKASVKTLQIGLYSVFSNVPIKHTRKRNLIVKEKEHSFISTSLQLQY